LVELKGSLTSIGLLAIIRLIGEVHHSGNLELTKGSLSGTLAFDDGRLVAAESGELHGLQALASCVLELSDADFTFVEGIPTLERTLDLGPAELRKLLDRITGGDLGQLANGVDASETAEVREETTCPLLGFADDSARHYSRPTALHRCFAAGAPGVVTVQEQRELCLGGRFATCPRYRNATPAKPAASALVEVPGPPEPSEPAQEVPPKVAARMAALSQTPAPPPPDSPEPTPEKPESRRPPWNLVLIAAAAVLGLLLVGLILLRLLTARGPTQPDSPAPTVAVAFEPVRPPTRAPAVPPLVATPLVVATSDAGLSRPTLQPTPTELSRPPTSTPLLRPTAGTLGIGSLLDVRFALGPRDDWLDNAPYAAWSDGAYRLQARDATHFVAVGVPVDREMSDVIVSATFRKTGGPPGGGYGLIVRDQGPEPRDGVNQDMNAYVFETGDVGEYGVWRRDGDHWVDLVPWERSPSVRSGGSPNDLVVRAVGDLLVFSVNGADVATIHDDALASGGVGAFVGGDDNEVALDHFSVQLPD
jgi:hypothetical protein